MVLVFGRDGGGHHRIGPPPHKPARRWSREAARGAIRETPMSSTVVFFTSVPRSILDTRSAPAEHRPAVPNPRISSLTARRYLTRSPVSTSQAKRGAARIASGRRLTLPS